MCVVPEYYFGQNFFPFFQSVTHIWLCNFSAVWWSRTSSSLSRLFHVHSLILSSNGTIALHFSQTSSILSLSFCFSEAFCYLTYYLGFYCKILRPLKKGGIDDFESIFLSSLLHHTFILRHWCYVILCSLFPLLLLLPLHRFSSPLLLSFTYLCSHNWERKKTVRQRQYIQCACIFSGCLPVSCNHYFFPVLLRTSLLLVGANVTLLSFLLFQLLLRFLLLRHFCFILDCERVPFSDAWTLFAVSCSTHRSPLFESAFSSFTFFCRWIASLDHKNYVNYEAHEPHTHWTLRISRKLVLLPSGSIVH